MKQPERIEYQIQRHGDTAVIMLTGDVDMYYTPYARRAILNCLDGKHHVYVDLSGVEYLDSSGVAGLVEGYQTARAQQVRFGLVGVSGNALSVLRLARLDTVFPIHDSIADQLGSG